MTAQALLALSQLLFQSTLVLQLLGEPQISVKIHICPLLLPFYGYLELMELSLIQIF